MFLQKLEIQGFKSFAEKTVLEFNHDLTAVVGPNGSGKSNISDAVRWVLGEQSLKLLRGKKSEDVIFAGSTKRARLGFAEVSLYLNNEDGKAPIDYREVVITRRIYRNGESEYLVNKNKVRLSDVQLLLAKSHFGQRTYSIIGQGMIDSILTSSPQERKEFFDEATGVHEFQIKKEQAMLKLEHCAENLAQGQQVLTEIEPRLRSLQRQVKRLERKEEIAAELAELQTKYYSRLLGDFNEEAGVAGGRLKKLAEQKIDLEEKINLHQQEIEKYQLKDTAAAAFQKLQTEYSQLIQQKNQLTQQAVVIQGKMDVGLVKLGKSEIIWAQNKKTAIHQQLQTIASQLADFKKQAEKLADQLTNKTAEQNKVLDEYRSLQNELQKIQEHLLKDEQLSFNKIQSHLAAMYLSYQQFIVDLDGVKDLKELPKIKDQAEKVAKEIKWLLGKLENSQQHDSAELLKIQEKLNIFLTTKDSLVNEIHEYKMRAETVKQKIQQLAEQQQRLSEELRPLDDELKNFQSTDIEAASGEMQRQKEALDVKIAEVEKELLNLKKQLDDFSSHQERDKNQLFAKQRALRDLQIQANGLNGEISELKVSLGKIETKKEDLEKEIATEMSSDFHPNHESRSLNLGETFAEIGRLKNLLAVIGGIDQEVLAEYQEVKTRHDFLDEQTRDLNQAIDSCRQIIEDLEEKIKKQFEEGFVKINENFNYYFRILFNGGVAKLILQKKEITEAATEAAEAEGGLNDSVATAEVVAPTGNKKKYEIGIEIQATPPGKKVKSLNMLSGGEKALTSIALICSIISNNPSPFVFLDEVDAALDEANSERFVKIIDELSDKTQFVCITHNRASMQHASILYGVTMGADGVSKLLSVNLVEAEKVAE